MYDARGACVTREKRVCHVCCVFSSMRSVCNVPRKEPTNIHAMKKIDVRLKSFRSGAMPSPTASIPRHIGRSQPSPEETTYSSSIAEPKSSNEPNAGLSHCATFGKSCR